ncbi:MAG: hypothetical protein LV471_09090 [Nitrosomonas sp.]|nr:hypothetical protein [Nitrosomonas sp.]
MSTPVQMLQNKTGMLSVLCDDGSIMYQFYDSEEDKTEWVRQVDIPQDGEAKQ